MLIDYCLNLRKEVTENCQEVATVKHTRLIHAIPGVFCGFSHLYYYYSLHISSSNAPVKRAAFYHYVL